MTLTDAGPLVAIIDAGEPDHELCLETLDRLSLPMVTTWPAFTEAMCLIVRAGGQVGRRALWRMVTDKRLVLVDLSETAVARTQALMEKYADTPMDLADASLVSLAEELNQRKIFSLDDDFDVYRVHGRLRFERLP